MQTIFTVLLVITLSIASSTVQTQSPQIFSLNQNNQKQFPFERTLWTYWTSPNGEIPLIVQICFDNIEKVAKKYNFSFICVNDSTVRNYIENYDQQFVEVRKKSIQKSPVHAADLLRFLLIEQHGGIWVDSTTIFLNGLDELQNIMSDKYSHLIANRFSPEPDVLLFYYSQGQNRIQHWVEDPSNSSRKILYNPYPNYEIWMIAAKKKAKLIQEVRKTYQQWTTTNFNIISKLLIDLDIYIHRIDNFGDYLYLNMIVSYVQQRKQLELDKNLSLTGPRYNAFEYYNIWGLHSQYGPMLTTRQDISPVEDLLEYSKKELEDQKGMNFLFFMKQFGYFRQVMEYKLDILIEIYEKKNQTFQQFLASKPSGKWCQNITWLVHDSIIDEMMNNSRVSEKRKFKAITKSQNNQWKEYCKQNGSLFSFAKQMYSSLYIQTLIIQLYMHDKIHKAKAHQILSHDRNINLMEWINIKFEDNSFLIMEFFYLLVIVQIIWKSYRKMLPLFTRHVKYICQDVTISASTVNMDVANEIQSKTQKKPIRQTSRPIKLQEAQWLNKQQKYSLLTFLIFLSTLTLYDAVDILGGLDQPETIFIFLLVIFTVEAFYKYKSSNQRRQLIKSLKEYELFYIMINYMLTYLALCNVRKNRFWLNWLSIVFGMVGPCVWKLKKVISQYERMGQIQTKQIENLNLWSFQLNKFRYITIFFLGIALVFPNILFIAGSDGYYVEKFPIILLIFLGMIWTYVLIKCIKLRFYQEACRLLILLGICCLEPIYYNRMEFMIPNYCRILHIFRYAVLIGVIYQMVGSEFKYREVQNIYFKESYIKKIVAYYGIVVLEIFPGRLFYNVNYVLWIKWQFLEHLGIIIYGVYLMALFIQFEKIKEGKTEQKVLFTEVQLTSFNDD